MRYKISALAAIATIADVMPLHEDNRNIYRHGISSMYRGRMTAGTEELVKILQSENMVTETDIGFKLAPMLNAPGRLYDNGAEKCNTADRDYRYESGPPKESKISFI